VLDDVRLDVFERQFLTNLANRLYGAAPAAMQGTGHDARPLPD